MNHSIRRVFLLALCVAFALAAALPAQSNDCGLLQGTATTNLPNFAGTLPGGADMTTAFGTNYLYVMTQWGFARASLANPANPGPYTQIVMGNEGGSGSGGIIQILCDCHAGSTTMDAAEGPGGDARMIGDWAPFSQGGADPGGNHFSGLAAQVAKISSSGNPAFGQQINLPSGVAQSARLAAIYVASTAKYFGYFPVQNDGVYVADITSPTGSSDPLHPIQPNFAINWHSGQTSGSGARLRAAHVSVPGYDKYLLAGATSEDDIIHVAEINESTGSVVEVASHPAATPQKLEIAVINGEIFIFNAAGTGGLEVYKYDGPSHLLTPVTIPNDPIVNSIKRVNVNGPAPFPAMLLYRDTGTNGTYVDIYDTKWITQGGTPLRAKTIQHLGAPDGSYRGAGFGSYVAQNGAAVTAYVYREMNPPPPGLPVVQSPMHTDRVDISCIAADPTAPPVPFATMTNVSAASRPSPENGKNYFGDKWQIADSSVSYLPITELDWDFHSTGAFAPEKIANPPGAYSNFTGYWPCDLLAGGEIFGGNGCYQSLQAPVPTYQLALRSKNQNPPDTQTFTSSPISVLQPQISIVGYDGNTLSVLAGNPNNGNASATQGNVGEATFTWTFTPGGPIVGPIVTVPASASSFSLKVDYRAGYSTTKSGSVQQVDLVANASLSPNPVLKSTGLVLKNLMQKAAAATLNSVTYVISPSGGSGTLAGTFLTVNGTATVTAPATTGNFTIALTYNYTDHNGASKTAPVSLPFTVTDFSPVPVLGVYRTQDHKQPITPLPIFGLTSGTTYYLFDDESLPVGVAHPGGSFYRSTDSLASIGASDTKLGDSVGYGPVTLPSVATCSGSCYLKAEVEGTVRAFKYAAQPSGGGGGGGNPPPPPTPTLTLSGPTAGVTGTPVTFIATATNFPGTVTYSITFTDTPTGGGGGDGGGGGGGGNNPGCELNHSCGSSMRTAAVTEVCDTDTCSHTYAAVGTYAVTAVATSGSTSKTAGRNITITQGGPPVPANTFAITGATFNGFNGTWEVEAGKAITVTANETDPDATFAWAFGDGSSGTGRSSAHAFTTTGLKTLVLTVTGGGTLTSGTSTSQARFSVSPPTFQAIMIPGAGSICTLDDSNQCTSESPVWATDVSITNPATQDTTVILYFAAFTDQIPSDLSTLPFDSTKSVKLESGQSWSVVDVVGTTLDRAGLGKGILFLRFQGATPIVTAKVYFTANGASYGTALPSFVVGPYGQSQFQAEQTSNGQYLIGLRNDDRYRFNVSLFNASSEGGLFHLDAFSEDGENVASRDIPVAPYSQFGVSDPNDLFTPDPGKRYVLRATSTTGALQAYASQLDRRNNDLVQVSDDTPQIAAAPDTEVHYYLSGVGRIEDVQNNAHWRTDLRLFNPSSLPRNVTLEFHYTPGDTPAEQVAVALVTVGAGKGLSIDDVVGNPQGLNINTDLLLPNHTALGLLKVSYSAPPDIATAPLRIGGRIYADLAAGTAGMQLSTYSTAQGAEPGQTLIMPGAQQNLRFRTNVGIFTMGELPTHVLITAVRQDGEILSSYGWQLNSPGSDTSSQTGSFAQIPLTVLSAIDGVHPMAIKVQALDGSPIGAYIVTVDEISADTVFIQGTRAN